MQYTCQYDSPAGMLTLASDGENLTGLWIKGQKYFGSTLHKENSEKVLPVFEKTKEWLDIYFRGKNPSFRPPLAPEGSAFRREVWNILCGIPYGQLVTYGEIGKKIAKLQGKETFSAQAVGGAVGHNPVSIIIPCHRVIGAGGSLTGYAGGIEVKERLLALEKADIRGLYTPRKGTAL